MADDAKERRIPLILIGVGLALYVVGAFMHAGKIGVGETLAFVLVGAIIQTGILIGAAFIVAAVLSVSFGEVRTAILKFAGAAILSGAIGSIIPFAGLISLVVFLGLIVWLFELEFVYAVALAIVYWVISLVVIGLLGAALR